MRGGRYIETDGGNTGEAAWGRADQTADRYATSQVAQEQLACGHGGSEKLVQQDKRTYNSSSSTY